MGAPERLPSVEFLRTDLVLEHRSMKAAILLRRGFSG